jgi:hypothetical protein
LKQEALEFPPNFDILFSLVISPYQTNYFKKKTPTISKIIAKLEKYYNILFFLEVNNSLYGMASFCFLQEYFCFFLSIICYRLKQNWPCV